MPRNEATDSLVLPARQRILLTAHDLFYRDGVRATGIDRVIAESGVTKVTFYRHFPSKKALLNAAYQDVQRWGAETVRRIGGDGVGGVATRMGELGRFWTQTAEQDAPRVRMLLGWRLPQELDEGSRQAAGEFRQALERLIAVGKQEGSVRAGVADLWAAVWLTLVTFVVEKVAQREWGPQHPHAIAALDAAWEAIAWRPIPVPSATPPPSPEG